VWRWLRFSHRKDDPGDQAVATAEPEGSSAGDSEAELTPAEELPPAAEALEKLFADDGTPADTQIEEASSENEPAEEPIPASELPPAASTLEEIFSGDGAVETAEETETSAPPQEIREETEPDAAEIAPVWGEETPVISATELPPAGHVLAELFDQPAAEAVTETEEGVEEHVEEAELVLDAAVEVHTPEPEPEPVSSAAEEGKETSGAAEFKDANPSQSADQHPEPEPEQKQAAQSDFRPSYRDWASEEKLASHKEWVESQGVTGQRADLSGAHLEGSELISVNLRFADLHDANLNGADLLLADLRDACLVRANLEDSCLVGANLEGANLEGAQLEMAMGLVPRQIAGANVRDAALPPQFLEFGAAEAFARASRMVSKYFVAMISACAAVWLILWKTRDVQLLTDSSLIPFLHSRAAAAALPTDESYLIMPAVLFVLYLALQFHLQRLWDAVLELPAVFPDGHVLGEREPAIVLGLLRTHFRWIDQDPSSTRLVEKGVSIALTYWTAPLTLLLIWARYLRIEEVHGTVLQAALAVIAAGIAFHASTRSGRPPERWVFERRWSHRIALKIRAIHPATVAAALAGALFFLSAGTMLGVPHDRSRAPQYGAASARRWAPTVFWWLGYDPYPDLTEALVSRPPANWNGADDQLSAVNGPRLNNVRFRYAQGYGAFIANAHLWHANFEGAFLSQADLRGTDLGQGSLAFASLDGARLNHANLDRVNLEGADMRRVDLRDANMSYASLEDAVLVDARLDGASLYTARLSGATLSRASLERADLRDAYVNGANLEHADLKQAYLWSAKLVGADMQGADLGNAILIEADLEGADLRGAHFSGTVLTGTNLSGANLDGADLRGASSVGAWQICSAKSRRGALLDDGLQTAVTAQCGAAQ